MTTSNAWTQITPDIWQIQIPLPFALKIVNCYLIQGEEGWTVLDTGLHRPDTETIWKAAFEEIGFTPDRLEQIVLTHTHPDHYGMAGWFQELSGGRAPVKISPKEARQAEQVWLNPYTIEVIRDHFSRTGLTEEGLAQVLGAFGKMRPMTLPHPADPEIIQAGESLRMGNRVFEMIHTPGHSDGHLVFYDRADQLLLSGDHILMKITPNIGIWPHTDPDPLGKYLRSLHDLRKLDVRLALPGHKWLIEDWCGRLDELIIHHDARLNHCLEAVRGGDTSIYAASQHLFEMEHFTAHEIRFALAETHAHLEYLFLQGELVKDETNWIYDLSR